MYKPISNNKGAILISAYLVVLVIAVLSAAFFNQTISESRNTQRAKASLEAFYAAQTGLNFAYAEYFLSGWNWKTHDWNWTVDPPPNPDVVVNHTTYPLELTDLGADWDTDGYYTIADYNFRVRVYQEIDWENSTEQQPAYTGILIVTSQGWDSLDTVRRTSELRLGQSSMYQYFYFFPETHTFDGGTYDGSGYGAIHVNGNIIFKNSPVFTNLTGLSAGDTFAYGNPEHTGYLKYESSQYAAPYAWDDDDSVIDGWAPLPRDDYPPYDYADPKDWYAADYRFNYHAQEYAQLNEDSDGNAFIIPRILTEGPDYQWEYDKYEGSLLSDEVGVRFRVDDAVLSWLASTERDASREDDDPHFLLTQAEQVEFNDSPGDFSWGDWIDDGHADYEKEFWRARYDCLDYGDDPVNWARTADTASTGFAAPEEYAINHEWWDDLVYGDDRAELIDDLAPAKSEIEDSPDYGDGEGYFLNTEEQVQAWQEYMSDKEVTITKLDTGETETLALSSIIKEASTGGGYINPMRLRANYSQRAEDGGIFITKNINPRGTWWQTYLSLVGQLFLGEINISDLNSWLENNPSPDRGGWRNPISDVTRLDSFSNITRPTSASENTAEDNLFDRFAGRVGRTQVLTIDVAALNQKIEREGLDFNGIIYVENVREGDIARDFSVRLINAGVLPEAGLTLSTPHNIYVQGNFNLDNSLPEGVSDPAQARDYEAINNYLAYHPDEGYAQVDFVWRPAALISTQRLIYTLSEDFNDPQQLPQPYDYLSERDEEVYPYCLDSRRFLRNFCPQPNSLDLPQAVKDFFADHPEINEPDQWSWRWIERNLDPDKYPEANDVRKSLLDAGNDRYKTENESLMPNRVQEAVIYNTAMISPYNPEGYILERWYDEEGNQKSRKLVGAFIQLSDTNRASVPLAYLKLNVNGEAVYTIDSGYDIDGQYHYAYYWHGNQPHNDSTYWPSYNYAYETRFSPYVVSEQSQQQSIADFLGATTSSWREISPGEF